MADLGSVGTLVEITSYDTDSRSERTLSGNTFWPVPPPCPVAPDSIIYLMRARRYMRVPPDWETWIAVNAPNAYNPSGEPITALTVQASWPA